MKTRGVLYITWPGDVDVDPERMLLRSIGSLRSVHPELPHHVCRLPEGSNLLDKARMCDLSPFDTTLFLDVDTVVLDRLDYGFEKAEQHGMAIAICECPMARRFGGLADRKNLIEYNTGVIFFDKSHAGARTVFGRWKANATIDSSIRFQTDDGMKIMPLNDQGPFALAMDQAGFNPFALPLNYNLRPIWQKTIFGEVKIWHDYKEVPQELLAWNDSQLAQDAVIQCARFP